MNARRSSEKMAIVTAAIAILILSLINQPASGAAAASTGTSAAQAPQSQAHNQDYLEKTWEPKVDAIIKGSDKTNPVDLINEAAKFKDEGPARYAKTKISELAAKSPSITSKGTLHAINALLGDLNAATKNPKINEAMANEFNGKIGTGSNFMTPSLLSIKGDTLTNGRVSIPLEKLSNSKVEALPEGGFMIDGVKISESAEYLQTSEQKGKRTIEGRFKGASLKIKDINPESGIEIAQGSNGHKITTKMPADIETPSFKGTIGSDGPAGGAVIESSKSADSWTTIINGAWKTSTSEYMPGGKKNIDLQMSGEGTTTFKIALRGEESEASSSMNGIRIGLQTFTGKQSKDGPNLPVTIKFGQVSDESIANNQAWWDGPTHYAARGTLEVLAADKDGQQALKHTGADAGTLITFQKYQDAGTGGRPIDSLIVTNKQTSLRGPLAYAYFQTDDQNVKFSREDDGLKIIPSEKNAEFKAPFGNTLVIGNAGEDSSKDAGAYIQGGKFVLGNPSQLRQDIRQGPAAGTGGPTVSAPWNAEPEPEAPTPVTDGAEAARRENPPSTDEEDGEEIAHAAASTGETKEKPKLPSIPVTDEMRNSKNGAARIYAKLLDYASKIEDPERRAEALAKIQNGMNKVTAAYESAPPEVKSGGLAALQPVATVMAGAISAAAGFAAGSAIAAAPSTPTPAPSIAPIAAAPTVSPGAGTAGGQQATNPIASSTIPPPSAAQSPSPANPLPEPVRAAQIQGLVEVPFESATKFVKYNQLQEGDVIVRGFDTKGYIDAFRYDPPSRSYRALTNPIQFPGGAISEQQMSQWLTEYTGWRVGAPKRTIS